MENKLILMGFKGETTDVLTLYKDYGEITLLYDVTNKKCMSHITGMSEDVLEMEQQDFLTMAEILNKLQ